MTSEQAHAFVGKRAYYLVSGFLVESDDVLDAKKSTNSRSSDWNIILSSGIKRSVAYETKKEAYQELAGFLENNLKFSRLELSEISERIARDEATLDRVKTVIRGLG